MNKKLYSIAFLFIIKASFALELPTPSHADSRIQYVDYKSFDIVKVNAAPAIGSQIVFSNNEEILDVASGFSQGWEFANRGNILFIKVKSLKTDQGLILPNSEDWNTNLLITTDKKLYAFDLNVVDKDDPLAPVTYRLQFKYPEDEQAEKNRIALAEKEKKRNDWLAKETERRLKTERYAATNWNYTMQIGENSKNIAPSMAYDDGKFTYLKFPSNNIFPVAFVLDDSGEESIINSHVENDFLVLHVIAEKFYLRSGNKVIGIYNEGINHNDNKRLNNGTTVPRLKRTVK